MKMNKIDKIIIFEEVLEVGYDSFTQEMKEYPVQRIHFSNGRIEICEGFLQIGNTARYKTNNLVSICSE
jgi:hypothetical protein